ncbi:unnamed protein product [Kuraishia capsulata CBS 1993]|uniref:Zn(2)-C6 fungal-type domain-containing protein n=1 Tax=Kuraishia capsulata CBS 1993 TaxID=1382522 RepID=W6MFI2_9ASCO|nr:uncharacterized protein KUCA_T00000535001 [Kuraishia capsulata CBS 1993]CDK24569.1 unnamed protein product [Kuraishia capsulata CBS 1993]
MADDLGRSDRVGKKPRRSYNCGPCKKQKIKCDTNLPCQNCTKYRREDQCYAEPPHPITREQLEKKLEKSRKRRLAKERRQRGSKDSVTGTSNGAIDDDEDNEDDIETANGPVASHPGTSGLMAPVFLEYPGILPQIQADLSFQQHAPLVQSMMQYPQEHLQPQPQTDFYHYPEQQMPPQFQPQPTPEFVEDSAESRYLDVVREQLELGSDVGPKIKAILIPMIPPKATIIVLLDEFCENVSPCYCTLRRDRVLHQINALDWDDKIKFAEEATFDFLALLFKFLSVACSLMSPQRFETMGFSPGFQGEPYNATFFYNNWSLQCMGHFDFFKQIVPYDRNEAYMNRMDVQRLSRIHSLFVTLSKDAYFQGLMTTMADAIVSGFGDQLNYESYSLLPKSVSKIDWSVEDRKAMWWMICVDDIENAVFFKRSPVLRSHLSQVPWPSNINVDSDSKVYSDDDYTDFTSARTRIQILTVIRRLFPAADVISAGIKDPEIRALNIMLMMLNFEKILATAPYPRCFTCSDNDPLIASLSARRRVCYEFHRFQFVADICIHRYRLLMDYIYLDNPVVNSICLDCLLTIFKAYNRLTSLYPLDGVYGPKYVIMIPKFISILLNNLAFWLTYVDRLSDNLNIEMQYWIERLKNDTHRLSVSRLSSKLYIVQSIDFISARMYKDVNVEQMKVQKGRMLNLLPMDFVAANTTTYGFVPPPELYQNFKKDCESRMITYYMEQGMKQDIVQNPLFGSFGADYVQSVVEGVADCNPIEANDVFDVKNAKSSSFNDTVVTLQRALGTSFPVYGYGSRFALF